MPYFAQLLPDRALRKLMNKTITSHENGEIDALYALYAKLTDDMRRHS